MKLQQNRIQLDLAWKHNDISKIGKKKRAIGQMITRPVLSNSKICTGISANSTRKLLRDDLIQKL